jgi:hypothetical protein
MEFIRSIRQDGSQFVTVFHDDLEEPLVATSEHPRYSEIIDSLQRGNPTADEIENLFDASAFVAQSFSEITERVAVSNGRVYYDGDEVHGTVATHLVSALEYDTDHAVALALFLDKLYQNPNEHSRTQLYDWLDAQAGFTIDSSGNIVGYKGVTADGLSKFAGKAIVDGEPIEGNVPNRVGSTISTPRSEVEHDPAVGCAPGLHVGTWEYASNWGAGGKVLTVLVNPRDVVSVPTDSGAQKLRTSRYFVKSECESPIPFPVYETGADDLAYDEDEHDPCEDCTGCADCIPF